MTAENPDNKWIGKRTPRPDGADKVTGRAAYAADTNMPGMIWGKVLRSPHAHARIKSIDTSKAEAMPGVEAVMTAKDIVDFPIAKGPVMLGIQDMRWMCRNVMARDKALFHGHPVAAVAATSQNIASEALKLIKVDYEVLPWAIDVEDAMKPGASILHDHIKFQDKPSNIAGTLEHKKGDVEAGFKQADVIVERSFKTEAVHQGYIEPHACLVSVTDGKATIWSSSQGQFMVRAMSALLTGMTQSDIRAIPAEIGGGFGGKTIIYLEPLALVLAKKSGKPVKMVMSREEVFRASGPTSGSMSKVKIDPLELRMKNSAKQGTKAVHGPVYPVMGYQETLKQALAHPHYKAPLKPNQGRGVASGYWFNAGGESSAQMSINEDGSVVVMTGHPDIGGSRASTANIAAELLGIDHSKVQVLIG